MSAVNRDARANIQTGTSLSQACFLGAGTLTGLLMPAGWDAAALTFQASVDGKTWGNLYDTSGVEVNISVSAGVFVALDSASFAGCVWFKARSGTSGAPVNQTALRTLTFYNRILGYAD